MGCDNMNNKVRQLREAFELTQNQLAKMVAVTRMTIYNIEKRKHIPSLQLAHRISHIFGLKIENVFNLEENGKEET